MASLAHLDTTNDSKLAFTIWANRILLPLLLREGGSIVVPIGPIMRDTIAVITNHEDSRVLAVKGDFLSH
jgi:hypothetical protein